LRNFGARYGILYTKHQPLEAFLKGLAYPVLSGYMSASCGG
jgi:hypothetical protein